MKIKDLPKVIKDRAMPYIKKNYPEKKHRPKELTQAFDWSETEEGSEYWCEVDSGNFIKAEKFLKIREMNTDAVWTHWSLGTEDAPFFLDEVLETKVNEPEVVKPDKNLPWHLTTEDAPIFNSGDTKTDAINLGIQSVRIINDSFKKAIEIKRDRIVEGVIEKFRSRSEVGIKKYGTTLDRNDLSLEQWLDHAIEEAMDFCLYLTKIKEEFNKKNN
jgi:hypothetical protein